MSKSVHVAVGIITSTNNVKPIQYFVTKRLADADQGGKWEFPGGKVEKDESVAQALARELKEEINIDVLSCQPLMVVNHTYSQDNGTDKKVCLEIFIVDNYMGKPSAQEGQGEGWFSLEELQTLDFPKANEAIIQKLVTRNP